MDFHAHEGGRSRPYASLKKSGDDRNQWGERVLPRSYPLAQFAPSLGAPQRCPLRLLQSATWRLSADWR